MSVQEILDDKQSKPKDRTLALSQALLSQRIQLADLLVYASRAKDSAKATCIEALEFATKERPQLATAESFRFVTDCLRDKAPRIKWEAAKVIGNTAQLFPNQLDAALKNLFENTKHEGTVVRWSAAFALGEIFMAHPNRQRELLPLLQSACEREEKNSIKKLYQTALKRAVFSVAEHGF